MTQQAAALTAGAPRGTGIAAHASLFSVLVRNATGASERRSSIWGRTTTNGRESDDTLAWHASRRRRTRARTLARLFRPKPANQTGGRCRRRRVHDGDSEVEALRAGVAESSRPLRDRSVPHDRLRDP